MTRLRAVAVIVTIAAGWLASLMTIGPRALWAQSNPLTTDVKRDYKGVRDLFIRAAEKMPEANYGFKPSPDVRSFGQVVRMLSTINTTCARRRKAKRFFIRVEGLLRALLMGQIMEYHDRSLEMAGRWNRRERNHPSGSLPKFHAAYPRRLRRNRHNHNRRAGCLRPMTPATHGRVHLPLRQGRVP